MITLIACIDQNKGLGYKGELLVHLPDDLAYFKKYTKGKICVQGRKTYESIINQLGHDLPKRTNIILTNDKNYQAEAGSFVFHSAEDILNKHYSHGKEEEIVIIGGQEIYEQFLPFADKMLLTIIHHEFSNVDTFFPEFELSLDEWKVTSHQLNKADEAHLYDYSFITYEK